MVDFNNPKVREDAIQVMQEVELAHRYHFKNALRPLLSDEENLVQDFSDVLGFSEGAWYRPIHNVDVTATLVAILSRGNYPRDLTYTGSLHDAGNSQMKVLPQSEGADWESKDKRFGHMKVGRDMTINHLTHLKTNGIIPNIPDGRILELGNIVGVHDAPYLGEEITQEKIDELCEIYGVESLPIQVGGEFTTDRLGIEAMALRSADRTFVMSALSFPKDAISHHNDDGYLKKAQELGFEMSMKQALQSRLPFFYASEDALPESWDSQRYPLLAERAAYNEGGRCESCYTATEKEVVDWMFTNRARELDLMLDTPTLKDFGTVFEASLTKETHNLIKYADGEKLE